MATIETGTIIAAISEITKLLIMAQQSALRADLTPEQLDALYQSVRTGFLSRDPSKIPDPS